MGNLKRELDEQTKRLLFFLIRLCLGRENPQNSLCLTPEELESLLTLAKQHEVQPLMAYGLLLTGNLTEEQEHRCRSLIYVPLIYQEKMEQELRRICALLEAAGFDYVPLKGAVIRGLYPEPWLRTSGDIDILLRDAEGAAEYLVNYGYIYKEKDPHEITLISPKGITIELHFQLIETDPRANALLERIWDYVAPMEDTCHYEMEPEMFYCYHIAHMAKHMISGGCGIRYFVDTWLLNEKLPMDTEKRRQLLSEGGLLTFAQQVEQLSRVWFENIPSNPLLSELESFILDGGVFGSQSNLVKLRRTSKKSTMGFLLLRIFPSYKQMFLIYPVLKKYPLLLPGFWIRRWIERLLNRRKIQSAIRELTINKNLNGDAVSATKQLFRELDLL